MFRKFLFVIVVLSLPLAAAAERRLGLVIGNDAYSDVPVLNKAVADADAIADALRAQGYEMVTAINANRREMNRRIAEFTGKLVPGDTAFLFFAGHGVEIDGENYLLPTDIVAPASGERDFIKSESIALSALLDRVRATGARTTIAIIDACRNNPFRSNSGRSIGGTRGLGRITAPQGTFVIFSAGAGQLALDELNEDDTAVNSVFTRALLPRLSQPGLELRALIAGVRVEVRDLASTVNHQQFPAYYDELLGEFYFSAATTRTGHERSNTPAEPGSAEGSSRMAAQPVDQMHADFELARSIGTLDALQAFIDGYSTRSDEFTYRMALQMLNQRQSTQKPDSEPAPSAVPAPVDPPPDRRAIIRATQTALNAAGCSAGTADGVIGNRTRRAFLRFVTDTGSPLQAGDLGTETALNAIQQRGSKTCTAVVTVPTESQDNDAPAQTSYDLAGDWQFRASCPLFIKTTGTQRYRRKGPNTFSGKLTDSLGQTATTRVTLNGQKMSFVITFPTVTLYANGTLATDGTRYTNVASNGCTTTAWRG